MGACGAQAMHVLAQLVSSSESSTYENYLLARWRLSHGLDGTQKAPPSTDLVEHVTP